VNDLSHPNQGLNNDPDVLSAAGTERQRSVRLDPSRAERILALVGVVAVVAIVALNIVTRVF
jgi:hypothetical protein